MEAMPSYEEDGQNGAFNMEAAEAKTWWRQNWTFCQQVPVDCNGKGKQNRKWFNLLSDSV